jgi:hypothetical protein
MAAALSLPDRRVVVCAVGGRRGFLELPESVADSGREFISGGERSLYELATAVAVLGLQVELRGELNGRILSTITEAAGAGPTVGLAPRRPQPRDVVILPEGFADPAVYLACHLSGAQTVVNLLAPPGLFGWSFQAGWVPPDPLSADVTSVGVPGTYRAMADLGLYLWSPAHGIVEAGRRAGVSVNWIGTGTPVPFPNPPPKSADIAIIEENRWLSLAEALASRLEGASVIRIHPSPSVYSLCEALSPARVLPWPSRVEGMSRISREARAVGTVPVVLGTNPFANADDHGEGIMLVPDLDAIVRETRRLLGAPDELFRRSRQAARSARAQTHWGRYLKRVATALNDLPAPPSSGVHAEFGLSITREHGRILDEAIRRDAERLAEVTEEHARAIDALRAETERAEELLGVYKSRRIIRLLDDSRAGAALRAALRLRRRFASDQ